MKTLASTTWRQLNFQLETSPYLPSRPEPASYSVKTFKRLVWQQIKSPNTVKPLENFLTTDFPIMQRVYLLLSLVISYHPRCCRRQQICALYHSCSYHSRQKHFYPWQSGTQIGSQSMKTLHIQPQSCVYKQLRLEYSLNNNIQVCYYISLLFLYNQLLIVAKRFAQQLS